MSNDTTLALLSLSGLSIEKESSVDDFTELFKKIDKINRKLDDTIIQLRDMCLRNGIHCKEEFLSDDRVMEACLRALFDVFQRKAFLSKGISNFDTAAIFEVL
jgi:glutaredoxin 2